MGNLIETMRLAGQKPGFAGLDEKSSYTVGDNIAYSSEFMGQQFTVGGNVKDKSWGLSTSRSLYSDRDEYVGKVTSSPEALARAHALERLHVSHDAKSETVMQAREALGAAVYLNAHQGGGVDVRSASVDGSFSLGTNSGLRVTAQNERFVGEVAAFGGKGGFMPRVTAGIKLDDGVTRSVQDWAVVAKTGFPEFLAADVGYTSNGKTFNMTISVNPITTIGSAIQGVVNWFTSSREGAFYETIEPDTKPMKGVYGSNPMFEGSPPALTEYGKTMAAVIRKDLENNPDAQMFIGEYKQKGLKKEDQAAAQEAFLKAVAGDNPELAKRIAIGQPTQEVADKELIRNNYANVVIANPKMFHGSANGAIFIGLTSTEALAQRKEIESSPAFKEMIGGKGRDEREALLNYTMSKIQMDKLSSNPSGIAAADILAHVKENVYDKGITLQDVTKTYTPQERVENLVQNEQLQKFFADNGITSKEDKQMYANFISSQSAMDVGLVEKNGGGSVRTMGELLQAAKTDLFDKGISTVNLKKLDDLIEDHLENMARNPKNEMEKAIGLAYKKAKSDSEAYMVGNLRESFLAQAKDLNNLSLDRIAVELPLTQMGALVATATKYDKSMIETARLVAAGGYENGVRDIMLGDNKSMEDEKDAWKKEAKQLVADKSEGKSPSEIRAMEAEATYEVARAEVGKMYADYNKSYASLSSPEQTVQVAQSTPKPTVDIASMEGKQGMQQRPETPKQAEAEPALQQPQQAVAQPGMA